MNVRVHKRLTKYTSTPTPTNLLFFDCESRATEKSAGSDDEHHVLDLGVAIATRLERGEPTRDANCHFKTASKFWSFVESRLHTKTPLWCFAHNIAVDLAWVGFWERLRLGHFGFTANEVAFNDDVKITDRQKKWEGIYVDADPPTFLSLWHKSGCKIFFCDTLNYAKMPLKDIGRSLSLSKLDDPGIKSASGERERYCSRDVEIIQRLVMSLIEWQQLGNLGGWGVTLASMSMRAYRRRFIEHDIHFHDNRDVRFLERKAFRGGRVDMLYRGTVEGDLYELDINSCYAHIMRNCSLPCKMIDDYTRHNDWKRGPSDIGYSWIAEVEIETDTPEFPYYNQNEGLLFPVGRFWTTLCGPELTSAVSSGRVRAVGRWATYDCEILFRRHVDYFSRVKQVAENEGNDLMRFVGKSMTNSLFGKLAQRNQRWVSLENQPAIINRTLSNPGDYDRRWGDFTSCMAGDSFMLFDSITGKSVSVRRIGNHYQKQSEAEEHPEAFPAISAFVTAWGRSYLWSLSQVVSKGNIYYRCVDSLVCDNVAFEELSAAGMIGENEVGKLKIAQQATKAIFSAPARYTVGMRRRQGGIRTDAIEIKPDVYKTVEFDGMKTLAQSNTPSVVHIKSVNKEFILPPREKGTYGSDGWLSPIIKD